MARIGGVSKRKCSTVCPAFSTVFIHLGPWVVIGSLWCDESCGRLRIMVDVGRSVAAMVHVVALNIGTYVIPGGLDRPPSALQYSGPANVFLDQTHVSRLTSRCRSFSLGFMKASATGSTSLVSRPRRFLPPSMRYMVDDEGTRCSVLFPLTEGTH